MLSKLRIYRITTFSHQSCSFGIAVQCVEQKVRHRKRVSFQQGELRVWTADHVRTIAATVLHPLTGRPTAGRRPKPETEIDAILPQPWHAVT